MRITHRSLLAAGTLVALVGLTACSGGPAGDTSAGSANSSSNGAVDTPGAALGGTSRRAQASAGGAHRVAVRTTSVVRTGRISLTGRDLSRIRSEVDDLLDALGGTVDTEDTRNGKDGAITRSTLVLRVPVARFDSAKHALERLGTLISSTESAKDVTTEVIDTAERVQTLQNSLDRLQRFQRTATDVTDLIRYEDQITRRQSELQSLKAQQAYLSDTTSMSTITLRLSTRAAAVAAPGALDDAGFLTGLGAGWRALVGLVIIVLTAIGAALPFVLAGAVVGVPAWVLLRTLLRRRRRAAALPG